MRHGHSTQRGRRGVQIVAPRSIIACAKSPGARARAPARSERLQSRFRRRHRLTDSIKPGDDPLDIAINRGHLLIERNRRNCRGGVVANARQCAQVRQFDREYSTVPLGHDARAGVQIAGARVIAEPLPFMQHFVECRRGERRNIRPARHKSGKIGCDGRHRRLLQHDFAEPDAVRVAEPAGRRPPRQIAAVTIVPGEQQRRVGRARRTKAIRIGANRIGPATWTQRNGRTA